jgi:hypothetical protein
VINAAAGQEKHHTTLNLSLNGQSSSLLAMLPRHVEAAPQSAYFDTEPVKVLPLDTLMARLRFPAPFALKLDVQGYELPALQGATDLLEETVVAEVELSLAALYEGGASWQQVIDLLSRSALELCDIERVCYDPQSSDLLQINGLFRRVTRK